MIQGNWELIPIFKYIFAPVCTAASDELTAVKSNEVIILQLIIDYKYNTIFPYNLHELRSYLPASCS